jgi:hypothetical protein
VNFLCSEFKVTTVNNCILVSEKLQFTKLPFFPSSRPTDKSATRQRGISDVASALTADTGAFGSIPYIGICVMYISGFVMTTNVAS